MAAVQEEHYEDEFSEAEAAQAALSGYENTRTADVEDQREYRLVPAKTPCTLGVQSVTLQLPKPNTKQKPAIAIKVEVNEPADYADGASNFIVRLSLNPVVGDGKKSSGWDMTVAQLSYLYAAINQCTAQEGKAEMINCVLADFPNLEPDDVPAFHSALVANAAEKLVGGRFKVKAIGVDRGQPTGNKNEDGTDERYPDRQSFGTFDYPKAEKK